MKHLHVYSPLVFNVFIASWTLDAHLPHGGWLRNPAPVGSVDGVSHQTIQLFYSVS